MAGGGRTRLSLGKPAPLENSERAVDWTRCIFCQQDTSDNLNCPAKNPILSRCNLGYSTLAANLENLMGVNPRLLLPSKLSLRALDGSGIKETLSKNKALWHKGSVLVYQGQKFPKTLADAKVSNEKFADAVGPSPSDSRTRTRSTSAAQINLKDNVCFLCSTHDSLENLRRCSTYEVQEHILECARAIDTRLTALLASGDVIALAKYHLKCLLRLYNKALRATNQAGHIWGQAGKVHPVIADSTEWGWLKENGRVKPLWTSLPSIWEKCKGYKSCRCSKGCSPGRCSCKIAGAPCRVTCLCEGKCSAKEDNTKSSDIHRRLWPVPFFFEDLAEFHTLEAVFIL